MAESDQDTAAAPPDEPEPGDPLKRKIAISLASVVLLAGLLAVLQTDASSSESTTARETTRFAVRAMRANVTEAAVLGVEDDLAGELAFLPYRRPLAEVTPSLTEAVGLPPDRTALARDLRTAKRGLPIKRAQDALDRLHFQTAQTTLKQQALATTRITWNTRATQYTTVIAVLAAALFLVGFGLIVEGRLRGYSYALGLVVALVVAVWGAWIYHLPIPSTPDDAIDAAARASVRSADGDQQGAVEEYDRSLAADDEYATAYRERAIARLLAANPDYQVTRAVTDVGGQNWEAALRDAERALELEHGDDFLSLAIVALEAFYAGEYQQAIDRATDAIAINPDVPDVRLLESAAETALGEQEAASASLQGALELLRGSEPSQRTRLLASTYLSYLEWVAWSVPEQAGEAKKLSNQLVATETAFTLDRELSGSLPETGTVEVRGLRYADGKITLRIAWRNLPAKTALSALGYERPLENGAWAQPTDLALFLDVSGSGRRRISIPLQRTCEPTEVRADIFLDGAPALTRTGPGVSATC